MSFQEAISSGFGRYLKYDGRASRAEFWYWFAFYVAVVFAAILADGALPGLARLVVILLLSPTLAVGARRMHDVGKTGWMFAIPVYNLYLALRPGDPSTNAYGVLPGENQPGWGAR